MKNDTMRETHQRILQHLIASSEHVRNAIVQAEHARFGDIVGMGADGEATSHIDWVAENAVLNFLDGIEPTGNILSEEAGFIDRGSSITYIVDPIDSTSNATAAALLRDDEDVATGLATAEPWLSPPNSGLFGFPYYAFSIAAVIDHQIAVACVRNLPTGDLFTAIRGEGARLNGVPSRCTPIRDLSQAWVALVRPGGEEGLRRVRDILFNARRVRITGCSALDICLVGTGSLHAYVNPNAHRPPNFGEKVVDYVAAMLFLEEAGGVITDADGQPLPVDHDVARLTPPLAAATPELHATLLRSIHPEHDDRA
jgi:myo-inositol-1(or 4)-monophosphatase